MCWRGRAAAWRPAMIRDTRHFGSAGLLPIRAYRSCRHHIRQIRGQFPHGAAPDNPPSRYGGQVAAPAGKPRLRATADRSRLRRASPAFALRRTGRGSGGQAPPSRFAAPAGKPEPSNPRTPVNAQDRTGTSRNTRCTSSIDGTPFIAPSFVQLNPAAAFAYRSTSAGSCPRSMA